MNMLENGLHWLAKKQKQHVSSPVDYCRNELRHSVDATLGRTEYEIVDDHGFRITTHSIDFLINAADLDLIPKVGDQIICNEIVHEVLELGNSDCWCWCDPHSIRRRIHTKRL